MKTTAPTLYLDHITITARTLEEGSDYVRDALGIEMPDGGAHPLMGTHNKLLRLSDDLFLEIVAINPKAQKPKHPRWFNLDEFDEEPRLATWVLNSPQLIESLRNTHPDSGTITKITRANLNWLMTVPASVMPMDGAFPALIEWPHGEHPATNMEDRGCKLLSLKIFHPDAETIRQKLSPVFIDKRVTIENDSFQIEAILETPTGKRVLK